MMEGEYEGIPLTDVGQYAPLATGPDVIDPKIKALPVNYGKYATGAELETTLRNITDILQNIRNEYKILFKSENDQMKKAVDGLQKLTSAVSNMKKLTYTQEEKETQAQINQQVQTLGTQVAEFKKAIDGDIAALKYEDDNLIRNYQSISETNNKKFIEINGRLDTIIQGATVIRTEIQSLTERVGALETKTKDYQTLSDDVARLKGFNIPEEIKKQLASMDLSKGSVAFEEFKQIYERDKQGFLAKVTELEERFGGEFTKLRSDLEALEKRRSTDSEKLKELERTHDVNLEAIVQITDKLEGDFGQFKASTQKDISDVKNAINDVAESLDADVERLMTEKLPLKVREQLEAAIKAEPERFKGVKGNDGSPYVLLDADIARITKELDPSVQKYIGAWLQTNKESLKGDPGVSFDPASLQKAIATEVAAQLQGISVPKFDPSPLQQQIVDIQKRLEALKPGEGIQEGEIKRIIDEKFAELERNYKDKSELADKKLRELYKIMTEKGLDFSKLESPKDVDNTLALLLAKFELEKWASGWYRTQPKRYR